MKNENDFIFESYRRSIGSNNFAEIKTGPFSKETVVFNVEKDRDDIMEAIQEFENGVYGLTTKGLKLFLDGLKEMGYQYKQLGPLVFEIYR